MERARKWTEILDPGKGYYILKKIWGRGWVTKSWGAPEKLNYGGDGRPKIPGLSPKAGYQFNYGEGGAQKIVADPPPIFLSTCAYAQWAHMHRFLSVRLPVI